MNVYDRHYDVKSGFGKLRRREVDDIRTLRYATQSNGGGPRFVSLTAWNDRKKKQFMIFTKTAVPGVHGLARGAPPQGVGRMREARHPN